MHKVLISLAANCDHEKNLSEARRRLEQVLSSITYTHELFTEPISSSSQTPYLNQLATGLTDLSADELCQWFKDTEIQMGRTEEVRRSGLVPIDLDLMQYDNEHYHLRDWERKYIKDLLPAIQWE